MDSVILTLNAGSSSLKFAAFRLASGGEPNLLASGQIEGIGATAKGAVKTASGETAELSFDRSHAPRRSRGGDGRHSRLAQEGGLRFFGRSGWPSHRARRAGLCRAGPDRRRNAREAEGAHSARAAPPAAQCRRRRSGDEGLPVDAASRVLRHRFPSQPSLHQRHLRAAALLLRRGRASLWLSRPLLRVHHPKAAHDRATDRARGRDHRPSRQRRLDVRGP